jgi:MraZ protein
MFLSTSEHTLDAKNRVSAPAAYRAEVSGDPHQGLYVFPHPTERFLEGGGERLIESYRKKLARLPMLDPTRRKLELLTLGAAKRLDFDATGRITLPKEFIDYAALSTRVVFVGRGERFEIWNAETFATELDQARAEAKALLADPAVFALLGGDE